MRALLRNRLLERLHFCPNLLSGKAGNFSFQDTFDVGHSGIMQMPCDVMRAHFDRVISGLALRLPWLQ